MGKTLKSVGNVTAKVRAYLETSPYEFTAKMAFEAIKTEQMHSVVSSLQHLKAMEEVTARKSTNPKDKGCNIYTPVFKEKPPTELPEWMQIWGKAGVKFNCFEPRTAANV